ncbi:MAG: immunoglobulin-like domain-containing protein [Patescibacteria group bacterium]
MKKNVSLFLIAAIVFMSVASISLPVKAAVASYPQTAACDALPGVMGDLNHDSLVNDFDTTVLNKMIIGSEASSACADFDEDGVITGADNIAMSNLIKGINDGSIIVPPEALTYSIFNPVYYPTCSSVLGDVNGDGITNYQDTDIIKEYILCQIPAPPCADPDGDGGITGNDAIITDNINNGHVDMYYPVITLSGTDPQSLEANTAYAEAGATAVNFRGDDISSSLIIDSSAVNSASLGSYAVTYNVTDSWGNPATQVTRTINVADTTLPIITLTGASPQTIAKGHAYAELGATAADNYDGDISTSIIIDATAVNVAVAGTYNVTYDVTDSSGNVAIQVIRKVNVVSPSTGGSGGGGSSADTTPPTDISILINNGDSATAEQTVNLALSAIGADYMMISNSQDFSGADWESYSNSKSWELAAGDGEKTVYAKFKDASENISEVTSDTITLGNGQIEEDNQGEQEVLGEKFIDEMQLQLNQILEDAHYIWPGDTNLLLSWMNLNQDLALEKTLAGKYLSLLTGLHIASVDLENFNLTALTNFITYGTKSTVILGAGERTGVLNSYKAAFNKLPKTETEWADAIKIANGRWPSEESASALANAKQIFAKVYLRQANMENANDNAAVTIMAYGLRPAARNLESEKAAIKTFKSIYSRNPKSAIDWDTVRAIAYSGATR